MKNKKGLIVTAIALTMSMGSMQVKAVEKNYWITYSPGALGEFKESLVERYEKEYGAEDVEVSKATGAIRIKVEAQEDMPNAPTANDITFKNSEHDGQYYVMTSGWQPASAKVLSNATYVVQYGALVEGVDYTIRYVDAVTNVDVETPVMGKANVNETIAAYAKNIEGYTFDSQSKTTVLVEDAEKNVITFYYTAEDDTVYVDEIINNVIPGDVVVVEQEVPPTTTPDDGTTTTPEGGTTPETPDDTPTGDIDEDDTPLAGDDDTPSGDIDEDDTPLAGGDEAKDNNVMLYTGIGAIVVIGLIAAIIAMKKRKVEE